jgi:histidinol-phosphate/aromatic aminotransferase/cobyric acid decarboxylase-like protein
LRSWPVRAWANREHVRITVHDARASDRLVRALEPLVRGA